MYITNLAFFILSVRKRASFLSGSHASPFLIDPWSPPCSDSNEPRNCKQHGLYWKLKFNLWAIGLYQSCLPLLRRKEKRWKSCSEKKKRKRKRGRRDVREYVSKGTRMHKVVNYSAFFYKSAASMEETAGNT